MGDGCAVVAIGGGSLVARERFERTAESVGLARLHIEDVLLDHGVDDRDVVEAAVLLVSELGTDALQHGRWPEFSVTVTLDATCVQVSVETSADEPPDGAPRACAAPAACAPAPDARPSGAARSSAAPPAAGPPAAAAPSRASAPDIAPHSRTIVEMVADSWDLRAAPTSRTAWFRLLR